MAIHISKRLLRIVGLRAFHEFFSQSRKPREFNPAKGCNNTKGINIIDK